jgi:hypothetical protein
MPSAGPQNGEAQRAERKDARAHFASARSACPAEGIGPLGCGKLRQPHPYIKLIELILIFPADNQYLQASFDQAIQLGERELAVRID